MGANSSCTMCVNPANYNKDNNTSRRKDQDQENYKKIQLQSNIDIKGSRMREPQKDAKPQDFPPEKSFSYDFNNFGYCREEPWIKAIAELQQNAQKENQFEYVETADNQISSQFSGKSLLNQLNEIDSPKELKARNFKIALQQKDYSTTTAQTRQSTSTIRNKKNSTTTYQNSSMRSKNQTILTSLQGQKNNEPYLDQFEKIKLLSETKQSQVFLVQKDKVPLVMKIVKKSQLKYQNQIENIWRERRILEQLDSSYTVRLEYAFSDSENIYLVTDYKPHGTLKQYIKNKKRLQLKDIKKIIAQLVACLQYLHEEQRILYRGLQFENILLDELMNICLCDFGDSKFIRSKKQINESFVFDMREENMSPEQTRQKHQDTSSDYWQLGILVYQLIYRNHPFKSENRKQTLSKIQSSSGNSIQYPQETIYNEKVTSDFIEFIQYCLTPEKSKRPHNFFDIQQTSLFQEFDWQEILEGYTSRYTQPQDSLHPCQNLQVINKNHLNLTCDENNNFLYSVNYSLFDEDNFEDIATPIVQNTKSNINNNSNVSKQSSQIKSTERSHNDQSISNLNDTPQLENGKSCSVIQQKPLKKKRNTLSIHTHTRNSSLSNTQKPKFQKQNNSIDGDDENDSKDEESLIMRPKRSTCQQLKNNDQSPMVVIVSKPSEN